jgi:hypothetical protein
MAGEGFFDELARGLADGTITRGKALRLMGAALVGGTLGSLGIGEAGADPPGCKRIGKHCTRDPQCCGSLVCVSGTCQTQTTTTTTETPTTSTTETPTTSTSTSTTTPTTTTTPAPTTTTTTTSMCLPIGSSCTGDSLCCSGTICCAVSNLEAQCLTEPGGSCTADTQCCGNAVGFGFCQNGTCCSANGGICTSDTDCCGDLHCDNGDCVL